MNVESGSTRRHDGRALAARRTTVRGDPRPTDLGLSRNGTRATCAQDGRDRRRDLAFARDRDYVLVTRDEDFERKSSLEGPPPKVVVIQTHNPSNADAVALLTAARDTIAAFVADEAAAVLLLGSRR